MRYKCIRKVKEVSPKRPIYPFSKSVVGLGREQSVSQSVPKCTRTLLHALPTLHRCQGYTCGYIYIYIYIYLRSCTCMCVCAMLPDPTQPCLPPLRICPHVEKRTKHTHTHTHTTLHDTIYPLHISLVTPSDGNHTPGYYSRVYACEDAVYYYYCCCYLFFLSSLSR